MVSKKQLLRDLFNLKSKLFGFGNEDCLNLIDEQGILGRAKYNLEKIETGLSDQIDLIAEHLGFEIFDRVIKVKTTEEEYKHKWVLEKIKKKKRKSKK